MMKNILRPIADRVFPGPGGLPTNGPVEFGERASEKPGAAVTSGQDVLFRIMVSTARARPVGVGHGEKGRGTVWARSRRRMTDDAPGRSGSSSAGPLGHDPFPGAPGK